MDANLDQKLPSPAGWVHIAIDNQTDYEENDCSQQYTNNDACYLALIRCCSRKKSNLAT